MYLSIFQVQSVLHLSGKSVKFHFEVNHHICYFVPSILMQPR
jgi:hypothetical protein